MSETNATIPPDARLPTLTADQVKEMLDDVVVQRIAPLEADVAIIKAKVTDIHELLMGVGPNGQPHKSGRGGLGMALHDLNSHLAVLKGQGAEVAEGQADLPRLIAEAVANRVVQLFQTEIQALKDADSEQLSRIIELEDAAHVSVGPHGTNGHEPT